MAAKTGSTYFSRTMIDSVENYNGNSGVFDHDEFKESAPTD